jgi:hypothetical protein
MTRQGTDQGSSPKWGNWNSDQNNVISGPPGALKSVLVRQNPSSLTEAIQIAVQMEQKWNKDQTSQTKDSRS